MSSPVVGIVVGSESDRPRMQAAVDELEARGIAHEFEVRSAHRQPDAVAEYGRTARERGLRVLIAGAGLAAALPGVLAAHTDLPVIGVPLRSSLSVLDGLDALLSIVQMPPGVPSRRARDMSCVRQLKMRTWRPSTSATWGTSSWPNPLPGADTGSRSSQCSRSADHA
jgi:phosphoribosylaminoimidazole carboxylase PurE protein